MGWSSLDQVYSPPSGVSNVDSLIDQGRVTYNYELPLEDSVKFTFDISASVASPSDLKIESMNDAQKNTVRSALGYVSSVTGVSFSEADGSCDDLVFGAFKSDSDVVGLDYYLTSGIMNASTGEILSLDQHDTILLNSSKKEEADPSRGNDGYLTILHEIGHALGLKHPFEGSPTLPSELDNQYWTVMSYTPAKSDETPSSYGSIDLAALNWLYGGDGLRNEYGLTVNGKNQPVSSPSPDFDSLSKAGSSKSVAMATSGEPSALQTGQANWLGLTNSAFDLNGQTSFSIAQVTQSLLASGLCADFQGGRGFALGADATWLGNDQTRDKLAALSLAQA